MITINRFPSGPALLGRLAASRPLRTALIWQFLVTLVVAVAAWCWGGAGTAMSALLGGMIVVNAGLLYGILIRGGKVRSAGETLRTLFRAEACKIVAIVVQLWLVLTVVPAVEPVVLLGAFVIAVAVYPIALLVRE